VGIFLGVSMALTVAQTKLATKLSILKRHNTSRGVSKSGIRCTVFSLHDVVVCKLEGNRQETGGETATYMSERLITQAKV
jgi:hypothetical protein